MKLVPVNIENRDGDKYLVPLVAHFDLLRVCHESRVEATNSNSSIISHLHTLPP